MLIVLRSRQLCPSTTGSGKYHHAQATGEAACARERNPLADAFELSHGLQDHHVDSRLILYEGFGHGIDKPKSALALMQANLDWFSHYLPERALSEGLAALWPK
jgi:hypothetical protein